ncbi:hypothetical protein CA7LBN_002257 [Candidozyma auris]|uniref:UDP-N-acetylglucosamine transferase subunit ALG13 n=1 Tax=Candidozyma auris TaxID=498019 RepID=A0A8F2W0W7_CANAR|nr:hypothetical protein CA7LBN_002257 [[Candida] auris]
MSILFTTGATVTFHKLVDYVVDPHFLTQLHNLGFDKFAIQFGNEVSPTHHVSKKYFSDAIEQKQLMEKLDLSILNEFNDKSVTKLGSSSLQITVFPFAPSINDYIAAADIVVSHAGTGSILDVLRLGKPLIVVTNQDLMNDHQEEVAAQFEKLGYLYRVNTQEMLHGRLLELITRFKKGSLRFSHMSAPPDGVIERVLSEELDRAHIETLLYALGDGPVSLDSTVNCLEDCLVEYLTDMLHEAQQFARSQGRSRIKQDDLPFALRNDPMKLGRLHDIKELINKIQRARNMLEDSAMATKEYLEDDEEEDGEKKPRKGKKRGRKKKNQPVIEQNDSNESE